MVDDVKVVIYMLQFENVVFVGFLMGGVIVICYLVRYDGVDIDKLILLFVVVFVFIKCLGYLYGMRKQDIDDMIE